MSIDITQYDFHHHNTYTLKRLTSINGGKNKNHICNDLTRLLLPKKLIHTLKTIQMKKQLFITSSLLLVSMIIFGQEITKTKATRFYVAASAGPTFPVGVFGSTNTDPSKDAGLAQIGYNINLHSGYNITSNFGIASTIMYSRFTLDKNAVNHFLNGSSPSYNATADHWQYWGINIGPMATVELTDKVMLDFKLLGGFARANMPVIRYKIEGIDVVSTPDKWSDAFTWQLGTNLRYNFSDMSFVLANVDYNFMKPNWKFSIASEDVSVTQKMGALDVNVGVGLNF
jgi:hypothetical protein